MALNFPSSPSINDTYTYGDKTWVWNGRFWQIQAAGAINDIAIGNITPNTGAFTTLTATGNITAQGNVQGQYILGNGAFLTGISGSSTYGNANVANYLPNYGGNISTNVVSGNFYANSILPWSPTAGLINDAVDIGNSTLSFRDIYVGNVITPAGDQGNATQIQPASGVGESGVAFVDAITGSAADVSAGTLYVESIDAVGNVTVDTFVEANQIIALSNVSGTGGNFSANVTAAYFLGNGAFLTGISAGSSYSNANVAAYLPNYQGLISNVDFRSTSPAAVAMVVTDRPITIGGNTYSYITIPNDGNANSVATELTNHGLGNVLISSGPDDHEWIFDNTGNLTAPGNIQAGNAVSANYFLGNGALLTGITTNYSNANVANYLATYNGNALFSNVTVSQDAVILGNLRVEGNTTYINVNDLVVDDYLVIIGNAATQVSDLNGAGLQIGNLANSNIQFVYDYTSNVMTLNRGANIANVLNVSGNVTGNYFIGNGSLLTGIVTSSYSNANVANYLPTYTGNVTAGNISVTGNVTANWFVGNINTTNSLVTSGNVTANNFIGSDPNVNLIAGSYTWAFNDAGNLVLPSNTFAVNYANGTQVALGGSYSNSVVANYLASNANVTITVGVSNITTQGNISGNYFIGNGALLTGVVTSSYSNANVANYLPTYTGNITAGNIAVTGNVTANWFVGNINTTNSLVTSGNITANNFIGSDPNVGLVAGNYTWLFDNAGNVTLPSNTFAVNYANGTAVSLGGTYSNADVANYLPTYNGNALFSNITVSRDAVILGNLRVEGNTTYINVSDLIVEDKDIIVAANANATMTDLNGAGLQIGNRSVGGNITFFYNSTSNVMTLSHGANIANVLNVAGNITATGNVNTGNLVGSGTNVGIVGGSYTWTFNGSGNLVLPGNTFAVNYANGAQVSLGGSYSNADVKSYLGNFDGNIIPSANITYDLGSNSNRWNDLYLNNSTIYIGAQEITANADSTIFSGNISVGNLVGTGDNVDIKAGAYTWRFDNAGNLTLPANTSAINYANGATVPVGYGNASVAAYLGSNANLTILSQGNITGNYFIGNGALLTGVVTSSYSNANVANYLPTYTGNIAAGNVTATGNVQGAYILGNGALLTGLPATYGNSNVAAYLASNANVTLAIGTGNITTQGNLAVGNLIGSGDNVDLKAGSYTWRFDSTGNLTLPANSTAIYYANGTQVPVGYGNANVATYLSSNSAVTILTTANITTAANISGAYILGNGALLTGLPATYGNSNVAAYLAAYNGNALFSNITVSQDAVVLGNLRVEGNTTYINVSDLIVEDKDIIVAANASATMTDLNGAGLQIGNRTAGGNITFFYNSTSNVMSLSHGANIANVLNVAGNISATGNVSGNWFVGNVNTTNSLVTSGNVTANNFVGSGNNVTLASDSYTWTFDNTGNFILPGNNTAIYYANGTQVPVGYGNANVATYLSSNANVTVLVGTSNITTQGNVSGNYFIGNGALLTGIVTSSYSNANVANYLASNANLTVSVGTGNITTQGNIKSRALYLGSHENVSYQAYGNITLSGGSADNNSNVSIVANGAMTTSYVLKLPADTPNAGDVLTVKNFGSQLLFGNVANLIWSAPASTYGNSNVAAYLASNANITLTIGTGNITTQGNVAVGNLIGSGDNVEITAGAYTWTLDNTGNLTLPGNTTAINYANGTPVPVGYGNANVATYLASNANVTISVGVSNITTQGNVSGNYFIGNGALLTGVVTSSYSNANVANYLPTYTGNVSAGNLNLTGNIVDTGAIFVITGASGNVVLAPNGTSRIIATTSGANVIGNLDVAGNVNANGATLTGNLSVGNLIGSGDNVEITAGAYTWTLDNTGNLILPGNATAIYYANGTQVPVGYGNANVATYLASNAAVTILTTANITTAANISGAYILGNGAFLSGLPATYGNSNVAAYLAAYNGNALFSNITVSQDAVILGNLRVEGNTTYINVTDLIVEDKDIIVAANANATLTDLNGAGLQIGNRSAGGNITFFYNSTSNVMSLSHGANIANVLNVSGNVSAGNFIGTEANTSIVANNYTWTFNSAGNFVLPSNTFSVNYANGSQVSLGGTYSNADVKSYLGNFDGNIIPSANVTYNLGSNSNRWNDLYLNNSTIYIGAQEITANANATIFSGNISANYILGNGALLTGIASAYGNSNVANYLASNANIDITIGTGNITTQGNISVGSIQGANANTTIVANIYTWTFDDTGNLTLPGNSTAIYLANGTQVPIGYDNSMVASYLASNAAVTILTTANITTQGNIAGNYFVGNGALLTGIISSSYTNANVANYLVTYNGNALFSNVTVSQDAVILGNLRVEGNTTYINVTDLIVEDKDIIVAANANAAMTDLNGAGLQIGNRTSGGNITFFYNSTSNVMSLSHGANIANILNVAGNVTATGNVNTGNLVGSGTNVEIVSGAYTWTFDGAGNLTGTGNVSAGNFVGTSGNTSIVTANYTWTFNNAGNLVLPGNTFGVTYANGTTVSLGGSYSNADVANYLPTYTGNITAGNVIATGNVIGNWFVGNINTTNSLVTSGNITANNFIGSAANTRIVANIYTWTFDSAGNLSLPSNSFSVNYANGTAVNLGGSYSNADVANYLPTYTGNITAGNITTTGNITTNNFIGSSGNTSIVTAGYTWVFDNAGNLVLPGNSFSVNYANGAQVALGSGSGSYSNANVQAYLGNFDGNIIPSANVTYNLGSNSNRWNDLYLNNSTIYIGAQEITANADSTVFSGNISANYITANISTTGNITAGNFVGSAANTRIVASVYTWTFNSAGNLVLPGNTFSVNYANGTQVTLGGSSSYSNADVANYLPTFTGNVGAGNLNITGNIIDTGALNIITGASGNITLAPGNSNVLIARTTGANITGTLGVTGNITGGNITTTIVSATGNVSGGNITTTGVVTATGNITGGNIVTTGIVSATGNVNASNLNVTGNIVDTGALTIITGASGNVSLAPNNTSVLVATTTGVNVSGTFNATGSFITAGNVTANNLIGTGVNTSIVSNNYTWTFNSEGNFVLPGNTFGVTYANGTAVSLGGSYSNADVGSYLQTYNGNALFSNITVSRDAVVLGNLRVEGNTTYINVSDLVIEDKDIIVAANASATMTDLNGAGLQIGNRTAGGNITFFYDSTSNVMSLSHGANIANVLNVAGNITANSLVGVGTNVELVGGSYTWTFNGSGNLVLPGNTFAVNYANGAQVSLGGSYSNAEVASYLASNANVTILTGVANITTQGNVTAGYFLGNATFAEGVSNTYFGNVSPSSPAQGDIWINSDTAVQLIYFVDANGGQWAEMAAATSISSDGDYTDSNVIVLLSSLGGNTISSSANITTTANIQGDYILGNGYFLSGITTGSSYGNANVANYLPTYAGNITAGNINVTGNVAANYIIGNGSQISNLTFANIDQFATAGLTVDELYLQAVTRLGVTASGASGYVFDQYGAGLNPVLYATSGETIAFNLNVAGHPFLIQTSGGSNYSNGLVHITTTGTVTTGASAQGQVAGTLYWQVPYGITGNYKYQCSIHGGMQNAIVISDGNVANLTVSSAATANTVTTAAQPNITSVGNLTSLIVTGNITGNTEGFTIGYRDVPQVSWSNATMALADASKHYYTSTGGVTLTVPSNANVAFPIGATIAFYNRSSANCTIAPQASVNIFVVGNSTITPTANRTITSNGGGTLTKVDTNTWMLSAANVV